MSDGVVHVLMVTDGTLVEYPPEIYVDSVQATEEAERWAWTLAGGGWAEIVRPFQGRWEVGGRDVRLVSATWSPVSGKVPWVGIYWTEDGDPDPEAELLWGRGEALAWVTEPPHGSPAPREVIEHPWMVAASYRRRGEEAYAVAHRAKVVAARDAYAGGRSASDPSSTT